ncbi:Lanthionine biosynthesis protein LanM [Minicystis rosea]|nr:Lanthionine biosynthesis protein LanM [Minicystis rosea]
MIDDRRGPFASRLAIVIARAASFPERVGSEMFVPVAEANVEDVEPRVRRWLKTVARDTESQRALMEDLARRGLALGAGLRTVRLRDPRILPSWAEALTAFLEAQPTSLDHAAELGVRATALASFERTAHALLPRVRGRIEGIEIADAGYRGIVSDLVRRLIEICDATMRFEAQILAPAADPIQWPDIPAVDATQAGWMARLERLPALAFVIGVACEQWRGSVTEILVHLRDDGDLLRDAPFDRGALGALVEFKGGAGDRHANGRSVALLRFSSGRGLVHKPKDLRHVDATMKLLRFLGDAGLSLPLAIRGVLCRDGYGWEERVEPREVEDRDGFPRFYRRLGMLMRLMQLLNGRDLWADNLVASGDQPILIDLECLFCPPLHPPPLLSPRRRALVERMESTVVRTAMPIQAWMPSPDLPTRDLGCLSHAADPRESGGGALPLAPYRPWLGAEIADPWRYAEEVIAGYREMHDVLVKSRSALLSEDGPLRAFEDVGTRYIWRSTWDCHRALRASVSPPALLDGTARETVLAMLVRGAHALAREVDRPDLAEIAGAEIDAFRRLDVPLFTSRPTSSSLFSPRGQEIPGHFAGTAWDEVHRRITALDRTSVDDEEAILRAAIDAARGGADLPREALPAMSAATLRSGRRSEDVEPTADEVMAAVDDIAALLLDARRPPLGTGDGWLALTWWPAMDVWEVAPAAADLISGALGPALFLAEHFARSGDPRSWTASRETLDELFELAIHSDRMPPDPRLALGAPVPGGLAGPGALCYVAGRAGASLGDATLLAAARARVARATAAADAKQVGSDLAFGLAGLELQLLRLRADAGVDDADLDRILSHLADRLCQILTHRETPDRVSLASRLGELVPLDRDGIALALARTMALAPALVPDRATVTAALGPHVFDLSQRGGRLAALAVHGLGVQTGAAPALVHAGPIALHEQSTRALVSRAEEAQLAARVTGDPEAAREARRCVRVLLDRRAATGRWFPDRLVDDRLNLSALDGLPALGSVLLRHLRPQLPLISVLE